MTVSTLPVVDDVALSTELVQLATDPTGGRLVAWAEAAHAAGQLGKALASTSFVPKEFRGKPEECSAAILYGDEVGMSPMQSLQAIYVVSGRVGMYAEAMVAIVQAAGHQVETVSKSDAKVTVRGRRRGAETWVEETWTTERARRAGYTTNKKYETDPQAMLYARAVSVICRQIAADALAGIAYSVEELELAQPAPVARVTRNVAATSTTVQRKAVEPAPEPQEPSFDDAPAADEQTGEIVEPTMIEPEILEAEIVPDQAPAQPAITSAQTKMMGALMHELGIASREDAIAYCSDVARRDISSRSDLTRAEASAVIEALNADKAAADAAREIGA